MTKWSFTTFTALVALTSSLTAFAEPEQGRGGRGGAGGGQAEQRGGRGGQEQGGRGQQSGQPPSSGGEQQHGQEQGRGQGQGRGGQPPSGGQQRGGTQQPHQPEHQPPAQPPAGQQQGRGGRGGQQGQQGRGQQGQQGQQGRGQQGQQGQHQTQQRPSPIHNPNISNRPGSAPNPRGHQVGDAHQFGDRARVSNFDGGGKKFEWTSGNHKGETRVTEPRGPVRNGRPGSFHATYTDNHGKVTREVFAGRRIEYDDHGGRTVFEGNRRFSESRDGDRLVRSYHFDRSPFNGRAMDFKHSYDAFSCRFCRNEPLWWFSWDANNTWGQWNSWSPGWGYRFFARDYASNWNSPWGYNYWNSYSWPEPYGWWQYTTSYYWRPYGYRHHRYLPGYAPRYGVLDYILAANAQVAWETRLQASRDRVALDYEERIAEADDSQQAALQAQQTIDQQNAVNAEIAAAQAEARGQAAQLTNSTPVDPNDVPTAVTDAEADQLANQVSNETDDQQSSTPLPTSFENALSNNDWIFLVASAPKDTFHDDGSNTDCTLQGNDMLKKSPTWSTDLIAGTGSVEVIVEKSQPGSCPSGAKLTMTTAQLQDIFNTFQETSSDAMSQIAPLNNPQTTQQPQ